MTNQQAQALETHPCTHPWGMMMVERLLRFTSATWNNQHKAGARIGQIASHQDVSPTEGSNHLSATATLQATRKHPAPMAP